ncbi:hypothetical protein KKC45_01400 [Patescibacteria group bacterium]|nr:hypothetical protein [Patescibacteria group bacterium]
MKNILLIVIFFMFPMLVSAHQPNLLISSSEEIFVNNSVNLEAAQEIKDPTITSQAVYDSISKPEQARLYKFTPENDEEIPIEVLVPVRPSNENFYPSVALIYKEGLLNFDNKINFKLPAGYDALLVETPRDVEREIFFEPYSVEKLYHGNEEKVFVKAGEEYFILIFEPNKQTGDFSLGIGTKEDFNNVSFGSLLKDIVKIKLKVVGDQDIPWREIWGLFIFIAGFVIGLGAVTVIDTLGFLGINSGYWTETTIRAHKVTKPLIWIGIILAVIGATIFYNATGSGISSVATFQLIALVLLVLNGIYLSFYISPFLLKREKEGRVKELLPFKIKLGVGVSLIFSIIGWWGSLFLLSWYLVFIL